MVTSYQVYIHPRGGIRTGCDLVCAVSLLSPNHNKSFPKRDKKARRGKKEHSNSDLTKRSATKGRKKQRKSLLLYDYQPINQSTSSSFSPVEPKKGKPSSPAHLARTASSRRTKGKEERKERGKERKTERTNLPRSVAYEQPWKCCVQRRAKKEGRRR